MTSPIAGSSPSPASSPPCGRTTSSTATLRPNPIGGSDGRWCATSSAATCSTSDLRWRTVPRETGFPRADVEDDFQRMRRRQVLARLAAKLRLEPDDVNLIIPFDEVIAALGYEGERALGLKTIRLGTVDATRDFDRRFRPTSGRLRERWERLALAQRRG